MYEYSHESPEVEALVAKNARKIDLGDFDAIEGWVSLFLYWKEQKRLKKQIKEKPKFSPQEAQEKKVRFRVVDED